MPSSQKRLDFQELIDEQQRLIRLTAAQYWQIAESDVTEHMRKIEVIKATGGKVMGFFAENLSKPEVFFKVYISGSFAREQRGLLAAAAIDQVQGIGIPQLVALYPQFQAILTEKRIWDETDSELKRLFVLTLPYDWEKIGSWLRHFHDSEISSKKNNHFLRRKFEKTASLLSSLDGVFSTSQKDQIDTVIARAQDFLEHQPLEWVLSHGDFGLSNIKLFGSQMEVVDFEDCQMAPRCFDLVNMFARMDYLQSFPHSQKDFTRFTSQFSRGYGLPLRSDPVTDFFYLLVKLDMIDSYLRRSQELPWFAPHRWMYSYFYSTNLKRLSNWLAGDRQGCLG